MFKKLKSSSKGDNLKGLGLKNVKKRDDEIGMRSGRPGQSSHGQMQQMKQTKNVSNNEMRFIGPRSHLEEEHPVDMVSLNLTNRSRKEAGPLGGLRDQYEQVRGKVGELENIGNLGAQLSFEQRETLIYFEEIVKGDSAAGMGGGFWGESEEESSYEEQKKTKKSSRVRQDSDSRDNNNNSRSSKDHNNSAKERNRPQVARYRLMNDDEEFEASPNEFRTGG